MFMAFSFAGVCRQHRTDCPWKPISEKLPLEVQPVWFPPGFSQPSFQLRRSLTQLALRILSFLPFPSPTKGVEDGEGRDKRGIIASRVAVVAGTLHPRGAPV